MCVCVCVHACACVCVREREREREEEGEGELCMCVHASMCVLVHVRVFACMHAQTHWFRPTGSDPLVFRFKTTTLFPFQLFVNSVSNFFLSRIPFQ